MHALTPRGEGARGVAWSIRHVRSVHSPTLTIDSTTVPRCAPLRHPRQPSSRYDDSIPSTCTPHHPFPFTTRAHLVGKRTHTQGEGRGKIERVREKGFADYFNTGMEFLRANDENLTFNVTYIVMMVAQVPSRVAQRSEL